jgi:hypothetical protein
MKSSSRRLFLGSMITAAFAPVLSNVGNAADRCCAHCGCSANRCRKVCRLVREDKKITTTCWGMQCEEFCVPGPSTPDCKHCETVCPKTPEDKNICAQPKKLVWISWIPGCSADVVTKRKLMKKTVTKTVPSFKWVIENACQQCITAIEPVTVPEGMTVPDAPEVEGAYVVAAITEK